MLLLSDYVASYAIDAIVTLRCHYFFIFRYYFAYFDVFAAILLRYLISLRHYDDATFFVILMILI